MKAELNAVDIAAGDWHELMEETGEESENVIDDGLQMLKELFAEEGESQLW